MTRAILWLSYGKVDHAIASSYPSYILFTSLQPGAGGCPYGRTYALLSSATGYLNALQLPKDVGTKLGQRSDSMDECRLRVETVC